MGIGAFLETFAQLDIPYPLHIIGSGPLMLPLKRKYASHQITFHGAVSNMSLRRHLSSSFICFVPSLALEGFGLIILEAIENGAIPIVSTSAGGGATFISSLHPQLVFQMHDPDSLKNAIQFALENYSILLESLQRKAQQAYNNSLSTLAALYS